MTYSFTYKSTLRKSTGFRSPTRFGTLASWLGTSYNRRMDRASNENQQDDPMLFAVGKRVQRLREQADIKPADFSRAAGFSQQYLWRLENGQQNVNLKTLARLALALDIPMAAILQGIEPDPVALKKRPYVKRSDT